MKKINDSRNDFIEACNVFEKLEVEPDTEDLGTSKPSEIKSSKHLYVEALKRLLLKTSSFQNKTLYHKYGNFLAENELLLNDILKVNNTFRKVLYGYSSSLENFKRTFSTYEATTKHLRGELDKFTEELNEYNKIIQEYEKFSEKLEEKRFLKNELDNISAQNSYEGMQNTNKNIEVAMKECTSKLYDLDTKISVLKSKIAVIFGNLEKAAKKFDYTSTSKIKIADYANEYKFETLKDLETYEDFLKQVVSMEEYINKNKENIKNYSNVKDIIYKILQGRLKEYIDEFNALNENKKIINAEFKNLQNESKKQTNIENSKMKKKETIEMLNKNINGIDSEINAKKRSLENLVYEAYKKKILLIID
jgi:chromosome segregation ATPase